MTFRYTATKINPNELMHMNQKARPTVRLLTETMNLYRKKGTQKILSDKSYAPCRKVQQLSRDARHTDQQEKAVVGVDRFRHNSRLGR